MVSSIQLGSFFTSGGRTVLGGSGGSGLDTKSLIEGLVAARKIPVKALEDKVALNDKKATALGEFKTLASKLKDATDLLRKVPGFAKESSNAFDYAKATITSNTTVAGSTYLSVTVAPGTKAQTYTIGQVTTIAKAKKQTTGTFSIANADTSVTTAAATAGMFKAGTVTVKGVAITLATNDTLNMVSAKFNAVSSQTGITTSVLKIADGSYRLLYSATATGTTADFDMASAPTVVDPDGVLANLTFSTTQAAANSSFVLDGQTITRQTNSVNDAITGLTFVLQQETPLPDTTDLTVAIAPDTTVAKNAIVSFMNAYNDIKIFAAEQTKLQTNGTYAEEAYLANNSMLNSTLNSLSSELSKAVAGIPAADLRRLADLGITFTDLQETEENPYTRNILTLDEAKLDSALSAEYSEVRKVLEFTFTSTNANVTAFTRTNALGVSSFTLNLNPGTSTYQATYTDSLGVPQTINLTATAFSTGGGYTLKGQAGTVLEGLTMLYASTAAGTSTVTVSQGIGDRIFNLADSLLNSTSGGIALEANALKTNTEKLELDIERMNEQIETYREQLLKKFSLLEQAISQVNTLLQSLDAQAQARQNS